MANWNFSYVIPSFLILSVLLLFYFALPRLPVMKNRTFLVIVINEALVIAFDLTASMACNYYMILPHWIVALLNTLFFATFLIRIYAIFVFTATLMKLNPHLNTTRTWLMRTPFIICLALVLIGNFTGFIFYIDPETGYQRGPLHFMIYVCYYFYLVSSFWFLYLFKDRVVRRKERLSILLYNMILFIGLIFRITLPTYLLFDTFCVMALLVIYLSFENPEFYIERRNAAFNSRALRDIVDEKKATGKFKFLAFVIRDYHEVRELYGTAQMDQGINMIELYLENAYPQCLSFYYRNGRFVLMGAEGTNFDIIHEGLRARFKRPWRSDNVELYLSVGFALLDCSKGYSSADVVLNTLGIMLEHADKLGDDYNILSDDSAMQDYEERVAIKRALEYAVDNDGVEVYLQPLIDSRTRELSGAEALARIKGPDGEIIPPAAFIPIAEQNGRINTLGEMVFEKVCRFIQDNDVEDIGLSFINVNLSPIQFMRNDLVDRFSTIIEKYDVPPEMIHLEITEESMIDEYQMDSQVRSMQKKGFKFVLDDYGKGYSNLNRLKKIPFINVKLDMEVVWDHCSSPDEVLPMMVNVFKNKGYGITAEGIETEHMAKSMRDIGCDYLQGMLFSAPVPLDKFMEKYADMR